LPTGNSPIGIFVSKKCPVRFDNTLSACATVNRNRVSGQIQSITKTPQNPLCQFTSGRTLEFERHAKYCRSSAILAQTSLNLSIIYQNCRPQKPYFEPHYLSQNYLSDGSKSGSGGRDREPVSSPRSRSIVDREKPSRLTISSCFICELSKTRRAIFFKQQRLFNWNAFRSVHRLPCGPLLIMNLLVQVCDLLFIENAYSLTTKHHGLH
jgi:hypothetical protein